MRAVAAPRALTTTEIRLILGNLYREKGQVGRAINVHQSLLQRPDLTTLEHAYVLLCLALLAQPPATPVSDAIAVLACAAHELGDQRAERDHETTSSVIRKALRKYLQVG